MLDRISGYFSQYSFIFLALLTLLGFVVRVAYLNIIPSELHRDEAAIAFNARMLAETGFDEHGEAYPIIFRSFGDFKLPVLVYVNLISMTIGGINVWAIRLPIVILATLLIPISYFLAKELFGGKGISLAMAGVVSMSVWHVVLSRTVYEPIAGLTFSTLGLLFVLLARKRAGWLIGAAIAFFISCFTYNLPMLLMPPLIVVLGCIYWDEYKQSVLSNWRGRCATLLLILAFVLPFFITFDLSKEKSGVTLFSESAITHESYRDFNALIRQRVSYKVSYISTLRVIKIFEEITSGYFAVWNPTYLFVKGNTNPWHSLQLISVGQFHWGVIPFFIVGMMFLMKKFPRLTQGEWFILACLFLSPIPNALTVNSPTTNRLMDFHLAVSCVIALGVYNFYKFATAQYHKNKYYLLIFSVFTAYYIFSWSHSYFKYIYLSPFYMDAKWNEGASKVALLTKELGQGVDRIYLDVSYLPDYYLLYPHFGLFGNLSSEEFRNSVKWGNHHMFVSPDSFGRFVYIQPLPLDKLTMSNLTEFFPNPTPEVLFVRRLWPSDTVNVYPSTIIEDASGKPIWEVTRLNQQQVIERFSPPVDK